jgi:branched-chain amino acid transport system ATP-binding protein
MPDFLKVVEVVKNFGGLKALDSVSLEVEPKKITILIGPNGSGKTTLINVISGFYTPDSGKIFYKEKDITGLKPFQIYNMGISRTFQVPALFWKLTVLENMLVAEKKNPGERFTGFVFKRFWIKKEKETVEKAFKILDLIGLSKLYDTPATSLSGGQMKLLEIGRALMSEAETILMDEPVSGVNPTLAHEIFTRLVSLKNQLGITFFIVEHRLDIALNYVDSVIAMAYGKVISSGVPEIVMADPRLIEAYLGG